MAEITIKGIKGNPLNVQVIMTEVFHGVQDGETINEVVDFIPDLSKPVRAFYDCVTARRQYCPLVAVEDNVAYVSESGTMKAGVYTLTIICTGTNGKTRRYKSEPCIEIYDETDAADITVQDPYILNGVFYTSMVQSDWDEVNPASPAYILNKPDLSEYATKEDIETIEGEIPVIPEWAQQPQKPSYTAEDVGAVPTRRTVNGKALSEDITLNAQDVGAQTPIADLAQIREGAAKGATAYQKPSTGIAKSDLTNGIQQSLDRADKALQAAALTPLQNQIDTINNKIPSDATSTNKLADKNYVERLVNEKQNTIDDLDAIRRGAAKGDTAYQLPTSGVPKTDLAVGVQQSLNKANTAYQKPSSGIPKTDLAQEIQDRLNIPIDNEPTAGSNNLVKSGGVWEELDIIDSKVGDVGFEKVWPEYTLAKGYIDKLNGNIVSSSANYTSSFIPVSGYKRVKFLSNSITAPSDTAAGAFYGANNVFIKSIQHPITDPREEVSFEEDVPENAVSFRFMIRDIFKEDAYVSLIKGDSVSEQLEPLTGLPSRVSSIEDELRGIIGDYSEGEYLNNDFNNLIQGKIGSGVTPLIPVTVGDKVIFHCGILSSDAPERLWLYNSSKEPLLGYAWKPYTYSETPLTITNANGAYVRSSFNMAADDVYISINGVKVWIYRKSEVGLAEWNYKAVGITKEIYTAETYDCWKSGAVRRNNGSEFPSSVNSCTGFIDIGEYNTIKTVMSVLGETAVATDAAVCFYDANGTFISSVESNYYGEAARSYEERIIDVPFNAQYVRLSLYTQFLQYWYLTGVKNPSISSGGARLKHEKVTLEYGALDAQGQMKPYSSDFFENARTSLYYKMPTITLPYSYSLYEYTSSYNLNRVISAQPDTEYSLNTDCWYKVVVNYADNSLQKKELVIDIDVADFSYNVIPAKTIKTFQYAMNYKKGRGLYVDGNANYSEAAGYEETLISNTLRMYLPSNYSPTGKPVKLIYKAHGTGGYASIDLNTWGGDGSIDYLADEGFALFDMFAGTSYYSALTTNRIANYNLPIQLAAQKAAYEWVVKNFNVDARIYVVGKSHGGLAGIYATNRIVPTRAVALLAPLITQIGDRYAPWGLAYESECFMCLDDMCFTPPTGMTFDEMVTTVHTAASGWKDIMLDNLVKQVGLNPYINGVTNAKQEVLLTALMNNEYKTIGGMDGLIRHSPTPVKVWCAVDDEQVLYANGYNWVKSLQNGGSNAQFRAYPTGHGRHSFDSFTSTDETIIKDNVVTALGVSYNAPRVYVEVVNFLRQF